MDSRPKQIQGINVYETGDGYVIYHSQRDRVHFLNHTAVLIYELCNGRHSIENIADLIKNYYGLNEPPRDEVQSVLSTLAEEGLLTYTSNANSA